MSENKAQMTPQRLAMMLLTLSLIWVLCFNGQKQIPGRQLLDTYDRMQDQKIQNQKIAKAIIKVEAYQQGTQNINPENQVSNQIEKQLCIVVASSQLMKVQQKNAWQIFFTSLLHQSYENYIIYYFSEQDRGMQIVHLRQKMNIAPQKLKHIPLQKPTSKVQKFLTGGQVYCKKESIVIPLSQNSLLLGNDVFKKISDGIGKNQVLWTGYLDKDKNLGRSYPYTSEITDFVEYYNYPFVAMGIQAFTQEVFSKIKQQDLKNKNGQYFQYTSKMSYGLPALMQAKTKTSYLNQIVMLDRQSETYITLQENVKEEIKQIQEKAKAKKPIQN